MWFRHGQDVVCTHMGVSSVIQAEVRGASLCMPLHPTRAPPPPSPRHSTPLHPTSDGVQFSRAHKESADHLQAAQCRPFSYCRDWGDSLDGAICCIMPAFNAMCLPEVREGNIIKICLQTQEHSCRNECRMFAAEKEQFSFMRGERVLSRLRSYAEMITPFV